MSICTKAETSSRFSRLLSDAEHQDRGEGAGDRCRGRPASAVPPSTTATIASSSYADAGVRIAGAEATGEQDAGDARAQAGEREGEQRDAVGVDAGAPRILLAAAERQQVMSRSACACRRKAAAEADRRQQERRDRYPDQGRHWPSQRKPGETRPTLRSVYTKITPCRTLSMPKVRISGWMRRRLLSQPLSAPDPGAEGQREQERAQSQLRAALHEVGAEHDDQARELPHRQVDHAADDDEVLADRENPERCRLLEHVGDVRGRAKLRGGGRADEQQDQQHEEDAVAADRPRAGTEGGHPRRWRSVPLSSTQPNFMAKFLSVAACRSGA